MSLRIYPVVLDFVRRLSPVIRVLRSRSSALAHQMERALVSVPLNVAEASSAPWFFRQHRGFAFASSALMAPMTKRFVDSIGTISSSDWRKPSR